MAPIWSIDHLEAIYLSPTNMCNLKCIMCPNRNITSKRGMMNFEMFNRLIDELTEIKKHKTSFFSELHLSNDGEPFLHPNYIQMLRKVENNLQSLNVFINTNGLLLNEDLLDELLSFHNNNYYIIFSLDASYRELYERIRVSGDYDVVEKNVRYFLTKKQLFNIYNPYAVLQFIVMECNRHNQHEFYWKWDTLLGPKEKSNIMMWWQGLASYNTAHIFWKQFAEGWGDYNNNLYNFQTAKKIKTLFYHHDKLFLSNKPKICNWPWRRISIGWDGGVGFCCMHWELYGIIGNLSSESLTEIFEGQKATKYRRQFWNGCYSDIPVCGTCDKRDWWYDKKFEEQLKIFYSK
jgi:uncharacterized Fe-S cluster-containing radical SAM superfamily protein